MIRTLLLAGSCLLAGCASQQSYVASQTLSDEAAAATAYDITTFVAMHSKASDGAIGVSVAKQDTTVWPILQQYLQQAGYTTDGRPKHHLSYEITAIDEGIALRIRFDHLDAARLYHTLSGKLEASGPFSVRDGGA